MNRFLAQLLFCASILVGAAHAVAEEPGQGAVAPTQLRESRPDGGTFTVPPMPTAFGADDSPLFGRPLSVDPEPAMLADPAAAGRVSGSSSPGAAYGLDETIPSAAFATDSSKHIFRQDRRLRLYGWADAGVLGNTSNPTSRFNGPYNAVDRTEGSFNQAYFVMEMRRPNDADFGVGGRVDVLYGTDFLLAQSVGLETNRDGSPKWNQEFYGLALPQAYVEAGSDTLSVQVGHFYTVVGYEGVQSVTNFFYSHAYSYQFAGPFTQWGGLVTWKPDDRWEIQGGPVNQWNTLDGTQNGLEFLGRAKYTSRSQSWWSSFAIISGNEPNNVAGLPGIASDSANRTRTSFIVDRKFGGNFEYVFHQWFGVQQSGTAAGSPARWFGTDHYLYYTVSEKLKLGGRFEWFRDEDGTRVGLNRETNPNKPPLPGTYFSMTFGPNYALNPNVMIRPEMKYDIYQGSGLPFQDGRKSTQVMVGLDVIVKF